MLPFEGGQRMALGEIMKKIRTAAEKDRIEGITLLGGEPIAHAAGAAGLARASQSLGLSVMVFSGYTLKQIRDMADPEIHELLAHTDILVDGPYVRESPEVSRRWIGSSNQVIHFLTDRYRADDPCWRMPNTLEIRFIDGELTVNGFPAHSAKGLWKRI